MLGKFEVFPLKKFEFSRRRCIVLTLHNTPNCNPLNNWIKALMGVLFRFVGRFSRFYNSCTPEGFRASFEDLKNSTVEYFQRIFFSVH